MENENDVNDMFRETHGFGRESGAKAMDYMENTFRALEDLYRKAIAESDFSLDRFFAGLDKDAYKVLKGASDTAKRSVLEAWAMSLAVSKFLNSEKELESFHSDLNSALKKQAPEIAGKSLYSKVQETCRHCFDGLNID